MVEAVLLPLFQLKELLCFTSTFKDARLMLTPGHKNCVNFALLFRNIFFDLPLDIPVGFFNDCKNLLAVFLSLQEKYLEL